jgi:hypothetical protein
MGLDLEKAKDRNVGNPECSKCNAADAVLASYRHALKDIARGKQEDGQRIALVALDTDQYYRLGKQFHMIVKYAFQFVYGGGEVAFKALTDAVHEIEKHPEATVKGWRGEKV